MVVNNGNGDLYKGMKALYLYEMPCKIVGDNDWQVYILIEGGAFYYIDVNQNKGC